VTWLWIGLAFALSLPLAAWLGLLLLFRYLKKKQFLDYVVRIFQEKPIFIVPRGVPVPEGQEVFFPSTDGLELHGCYLPTSAYRRKGVILFGLEFGSNCWSCVAYCENLLANGFDVFAFETRNQGDSQSKNGYEPLQWVTNFEVEDTEAALQYLKNRPDADPTGVGLFGISKGGSAGLLAAHRNPYVRCFVTDGVFATFSTMVPYMRKWVSIYSDKYWIQVLLPNWVYGLFGKIGLKRLSREKRCWFPHLERSIGKLAPRPLLMIHGGADTYIKPEMAESLFKKARYPKQYWLVDGAKHNQALQVAGEEYRQRLLNFFETHLAPKEGESSPEHIRKREPLEDGEIEKRRATESMMVPVSLKFFPPNS
jgi:uncharacterized protein